MSQSGSRGIQLHGDDPEEDAFCSRIEYEEKKREKERDKKIKILT